MSRSSSAGIQARVGWRSRVVVVGALGLVGSGAVVAALTEPARAAAIQQSWTTAGHHEFVVPSGVTTLTVTVSGAGGGRGGNGHGGSGGQGGPGALGTFTITVAEGDVIGADLGATGQRGGDSDKDDAGSGGWGANSRGGASGGTGATVAGADNARAGGGGGGASTLTVNGVDVVIAGGGGGGGGGAADGATGHESGGQGGPGAGNGQSVPSPGGGGGSAGSNGAGWGTGGGDASSGSGSAGGGGGGGGYRGGSGGNGGTFGIGGGGGGGGGSNWSVGSASVTQVGGWSVQDVVADGTVRILARQLFATGITVTAPQGVVTGQSFTVPVSVAAAAGGQGPTGSVTLDAIGNGGSTPLGTVTLAGGGATVLVPAGLPAGDYTLAASYTPDGASDSYPSTGQAQLSVARGATTVDLGVPDEPVVVGSPVTFTAQVRRAAPSVGVPTGTVSILADGVPLGNPVPIDATGAATYSTRGLAAQVHQITAAYSGDDRFDASTSAPKAMAVNRGAVTITLSSPYNPVVVGADVVVRAAVAQASTSAPVPTGTLRLYDGTTATPLTDAVALDHQGVARFTVPGLAVGEHRLFAVYSGDGSTHQEVSSFLTQQVLQRTGTPTLKIFTGSLIVAKGRSVLMKARLTPDGGDLPLPAGTVTYYDNGKALGAPSPVSSTRWGGAVLRKLRPGPHRITARYTPEAGSPYRPTTSNVVVLSVRRTPPAVVLDAKVRALGGDRYLVRVAAERRTTGRAVGGLVRVRLGDDAVVARVSLRHGRARFVVTAPSADAGFVLLTLRGRHGGLRAERALALR
ncbi:Ig-like domain-containing protein [Nocardioides nitrophenolicus]|uniref:Ig-like domain-containing protein n=1 Tax=Nocardioides nitrophenolicus TaxID=60489 RepID=UPI0019579B77|nr:Ig-like domain-containing protein [Nocardioides nitrophenolicus]MBM7518674.1 hypothetical protein [Nocardioides nitrophenolicus]